MTDGNLYIGIDPGNTGAIAVAFHGRVYELHKMPSTPAGIFVLLQDLKQAHKGLVTAILENVGGYRPGNSAIHHGTFNRHIGNLEGFCIALGMSICRVSPSKWIN